jgi:ABC-type sugar transport system permease subunit
MSEPTQQRTTVRHKTAFLASVIFMTIAWLLLSGFVAQICVGLFHNPRHRIIKDPFTSLLEVLLVSAWALIPVQMVRYFRERRKRNGG